MKCRFCHNRIDKNVNFCPRCGREIGALSTRTNRNKIMLKFIFSVLVTVIIVCSVIFILRKINVMKSVMSSYAESALREAGKAYGINDDVDSLLGSEKDTATVFTEYLDNIGCDFSVLSEEYEHTEQYAGEDAEIHYMWKELDAFGDGWYVSYVYWEGSEFHTDGEIIDVTFVAVDNSTAELEETVFRLTEIYGNYDEVFSYPFDIYPTDFFSQIQYTTYQWNQIENGQYSLRLTVTESELKIGFFEPIDEVHLSELLKPIEMRNQGIKQNDGSLYLNAYNHIVVENCEKDEEFLEELVEFLFLINSSNVTEFNEEFVDYERIDPSYGLSIITNDFGWEISETVIPANSFWVNMKFCIVIDGKEVSRDEYLIVGEMDNEWKICNSPRLGFDLF